MKPSHIALKVVALTTSIALVGAYVGWRALRADARPPVGASTTTPGSPAALQPQTEEMDPYAHMGGSKSEAVLRIVDPQKILPFLRADKPPPPAPETPRK